MTSDLFEDRSRLAYSAAFAFVASLLTALAPCTAAAFCGFYVAKGDAELFNEASKVVIARREDRTVLTMANDFKGDLEEFAIVVPVPTLLEKGQINVADPGLVKHLDDFTAPRLVEYFDENPCERRVMMQMRATPMADAAGSAARAKALGVKIEAEYTVGEYDIVILSAEQSDGLRTWLVENGYTMPKGAESVLGSYIKQDMKFFVAKVNLEAQSKLGYTFLRPLQVAFETEKFMLPIRLGTLNANGTQELFIYTLTSKGRVETTNYRTVKMPTDTDLPVHTRDEFSKVYPAIFDEQVAKDGMRSVFLEYAWDMSWCDPCAADPLSPDELRRLGVFWMGDQGGGPRPMPRPNRPGGIAPRLPQPPRPQAVRDVFVTRLHVRYDAKNFPEDLMFQETGDRQNFQARYVLRHAWDGDPNQCPEARGYFEQLDARREKEAENLASLTGWPIGPIRDRMKLEGKASKTKWWEDLWRK